MFKNNLNRSLRVGIIGLMAVVTIINTVVVYFSTNKNVKEVLLSKAEEKVETLAREVSSIIEIGGYEENLQKIVVREAEEEDVIYAIVISKDLQAIAHSDAQKRYKTYEDEYTIDGAKYGKQQNSMWYAEVQEMWARDIMVPIYANGELFGTMCVGIIPEMGVTGILTSLVRGQIITCVIDIAVVAIFVSILVKRLLKPLENVNKYFEPRSELDFSVNEYSKTIDEYLDRPDVIGEIVRGIDKMILNLRDNMAATSEYLEHMASGDFSSELNGDFKGEFIKIKNSLLHINNSLNSTLNQIQMSSNEVAQGSNQVAIGSQTLSQGATEQASAIQELSATIVEISDNVNKNAQGANSATVVVTGVGDKIQTSNKQMQDMLISINDINKKSNEIGKIIKTIDDIAFQTNILALNAAVEAARAGAAGKGFAVVADEVRNLAQKSAEAAKNTTELIEGVVSAIEKGSGIAKGAADVLLSVAQETDGMVSTIKEISKASNQQADAINQVTTGIEQISAVVQTNSATSEESAAVSEELSAQAQELQNVVSGFKLLK